MSRPEYLSSCVDRCSVEGGEISHDNECFLIREAGALRAQLSRAVALLRAVDDLADPTKKRHPYTVARALKNNRSLFRAFLSSLDARIECEHGVGMMGFDNGVPCDCDPCKIARMQDGGK